MRYVEACGSPFDPRRVLFGRSVATVAAGGVGPLAAPGIGLVVDGSLFAQYPAIDGPGYVVRF